MEDIVQDWGLKALTINEAVTKKKGVLMVLEGDSFFSNIPSRNKRSYKGETWPNALGKPEIKHMLEHGLMLGTVGHLEADTDTLIRDGKVAIRTSKLSFNKSIGIGKGTYEVLDTPLGRSIRDLYGSGSKFFVSTKAKGEYKGTDNEGNQIVDPDNFQLNRIDLVCDPGFLQAQPQLREQLEEAYNHVPDNDIVLEVIENDKKVDRILNLKNKEDISMSTELAEKVMTEKIALEKELSSMAKDLEISNGKVEKFEKSNENAEDLVEKVGSFENRISEYDAYFEEVGNMEKIKETLLNAKAFAERVNSLGDIDSLEEKITQLDSFLELGDDSESMKDALESVINVHTTLQEIVDVEDGEDAVLKIKEALEGAEQTIKATQDKEFKSDVAEVAASCGVEDENIQELVKAQGKEGAKKILENLAVTGKKVSISESNIEETDDSYETKQEDNTDRLFKNITG